MELRGKQSGTLILFFATSLNMEIKKVLHYNLVVISLLYAANLLFQSIYGVEVCPYIDQLESAEIVLGLTGCTLITIGLRAIYFRSTSAQNAIKEPNKRTIITELAFVLLIGVLWGIYNGVMNQFPLESSFKVLTGFLTVGVLSGILYYCVKKANLMQWKLTHDYNGEGASTNQNTQSISREIIILTVLIILLAVVNGIFIIIKDLQWIVGLESKDHYGAISSIIVEIIFLVGTYLLYLLFISKYYFRYLSLQFENQTQVLVAVSNGNLKKMVNVHGNNEFSVLAKYTNDMITKLRGHLELEHSIEYAKRIQSTILPANSEFDTAFSDWFLFYQPKSIVAGDFYWIKQMHGKTYFAVADCTGHGVPGAMVSLICSTAMNKAIKDFDLKTTGAILDKTKELVLEKFQNSDHLVKDGMDIALCSIEGDQLEFSGAYHSMYILRNEELITLKAERRCIGECHDNTPFQSQQFQLEKGDALYLFSDGYADQFGGKQGKKLKTKAFKSLLLSIQDLSMEEQQKQLSGHFEKWRGSHEQVDDVCVLGIKY